MSEVINARNPHHHNVAVIINEGNNNFSVQQYDYSSTYPANVPNPNGRRFLRQETGYTYGQALVRQEQLQA